ncbi:MAG: 2-phosphosulfolactate phosphatase [Candidatus Zixiibacteriota bacterium]
MHIAVSLSPGSRAADIAMFGPALGCCVVVDILRASTVLCTALSNGAQEIIPVANVETARTFKSNAADSDTLLCGERGGRKLPGFDLGNSPSEYTRETVSGRRLVFSSTNGSQAIAAAPPGVEVLIGGLVNLSAAAEKIAAVNLPTLIVCSGKLGQFALEDAVGAGALISRLWELDADVELVNDGALTAQILWDRFRSDPAMPLWQSEHGKYLIGLGFGGDLSVCAAVDSVPVVPVLRDGRLALD